MNDLTLDTTGFSDYVFPFSPHFADPNATFTPIAGINSSAGKTNLTPVSKGYIPWRGQYNYQFHDQFRRKDFFLAWQEQNASANSFWLPSWLSDFITTASIGNSDTEISYRDNGFEEVFSRYSDLSTDYTDPANPPRMQWGIMVVSGDNGYIRPITAVTDTGITVASSLGVDIDLGNVELLSLVRRVRYEADTLAFQFRTDIVAECEVAFKEVIAENEL